MFSGIIDGIGEISESQPVPGGRRLAIRAPGYWPGTAGGSSIAIDGVCLTIARLSGDVAWFDVIKETLDRTTLGNLRPKGRVNLQKSLAIGDRIDGHFVQGHVDAVATVARVDRTDQEAVWWFDLEPAAMAFVIPKGSIAIDGISLTIASVKASCFSVALIPTTLERTTLGSKGVGQHVNIETDILVRTIVHSLEALRDANARRSEDSIAARSMS